MHILSHLELAQSNNFCAQILLIPNPLVERRQRHLKHCNFLLLLMLPILSWDLKNFFEKFYQKRYAITYGIPRQLNIIIK
jgi:hypothetical protein